MAEIQRYALYSKEDGTGLNYAAFAAPEGEWCRASDVEKLAAENERLRSALEWYAKSVKDLKTATDCGDIFDQMYELSLDGGKRARDELDNAPRQEPLGAEFEAVWDANVDALYEG